MGRLNDTEAISSRPLKGGNQACPDAGEAQTARRGELARTYSDEGMDRTGRTGSPNAGVESGKAALGYLGKKVGERK